MEKQPKKFVNSIFFIHLNFLMRVLYNVINTTVLDFAWLSRVLNFDNSNNKRLVGLCFYFINSGTDVVLKNGFVWPVSRFTYAWCTWH